MKGEIVAFATTPTTDRKKSVAEGKGIRPQ